MTCESVDMIEGHHLNILSPLWAIAWSLKHHRDISYNITYLKICAGALDQYGIMPKLVDSGTR